MYYNIFSVSSLVKEYLTDSKDRKSSTRLFAFFFIKLFFILNACYLVLIFIILGCSLFFNKTLNTELFIGILGYFATSNLLLLVAIFIPKSLDKITTGKYSKNDREYLE